MAKRARRRDDPKQARRFRLPVDGKTDAALVIGSTFSDPFADIHITPIGKGGTTPESLDVVVKIGSPPGNQAPTLTLSASVLNVAPATPVNFAADASDPDGDTLAYAWDFGDKSLGSNRAALGKSWNAPGEYVVRCVASDMQGGTASDSVVVTVGTPATHRITGTVTFQGQPLADTLITVTAAGQTTTRPERAVTDGDGTYALVGLPAGGYTVRAARNGYTFAASGFTNPVTLGPGAANIHFTAQLARYTISGRIVDGNFGVAGAQVRDGTRSATTDSNGNYTLTGVPTGLYTLAARKAGYELVPPTSVGIPFLNIWRNPVEVNGGNVTGRDFLRPLVTVSGSIFGAEQAVTVGIGDTVHTTTSYNQGGTWRYSLRVPKGRWNLRATLSGYTITPDNFANPLLVSGATLINLNFRAGVGTTYAVSGTIRQNGVPLSGVVVGDGTRSGTSDTIGGYTIVGVPNGSHLLVPRKQGYRFVPAFRSVTITGADRGVQDFTAVEDSVAPPITSIRPD